MALKCVSDTVAEALGGYVMQVFPCPDKHVLSLTPNTPPLWMICDCARLCIRAAGMIQSVVAQVTADVLFNKAL